MDLTTPGAFALTDSMPGSQIAGFARKLEQLGYGSFWFPEAFGRDPFALAAHILSVTDRLVVGTGIANVWKREPVAMIGAARTLAELFPDRFILGIGISHAPMMAQLGINYAKPVAYMRDYLARMKAAPYTAPRPKTDPPFVIAALMPKMLKLAAAETNGTFPVYITPEQTARMRAALGAGKWICIQQVTILEPDSAKARRAARKVLAFYLTLPNYVSSFRSQGFGDADFADGGSDRLIDGLIAWGDEQAIRNSVAAHYKAGATHVSLTVVPSEGTSLDRTNSPDTRAFEALAPRR
ncbi:MAG TPA: TIGR03620 family F420-dependent LLM class oxidoreductase [Candidatus Binataceae bacterium]|nr:TIGR03620 family F420-dependent LLM class oxidoreductase [Candidatus Binataceae bacterium]